MRATKSKDALNEPEGQRLFDIYTALSHIRVASYTSCALPCLNFKQTAVKVISKVQQPIIDCAIRISR
jgi:hypothetical protein